MWYFYAGKNLLHQTLGIGKLPQVQLWAAKMRLQAASVLYLGDLVLIRRKANRIQREGRRLVLNFHCVLIDPHGNLFSGQLIFPKEPPMLELQISVPVQMARKLRGVQRPREHLFWIGAPQYPTQHRVRTVSPILALTMGVMVLAVVVLPPGLVCLLDLRPGARMGERMVSKPSLNV